MKNSWKFITLQFDDYFWPKMWKFVSLQFDGGFLPKNMWEFVSLQFDDFFRKFLKIFLPSIWRFFTNFAPKFQKGDPTFTQAQWLKITQNFAFEFWHFPPIFVLSGNTLWPQASSFQKITKIDYFWAFLLNFWPLKM